MVSKTRMLGLVRDLPWQVAQGENRRLAAYLRERGAGPNHCLWASAFRDDVPTTELLAGASAETDPVTEDETPFLHATKTSHFRAAKALLDLGADVNLQDQRGMTALHYMLKKRSDERHFRMVVEYGARGDLPNRDGVTAKEIMMRKRGAAFREMALKLP